MSDIIYHVEDSQGKGHVAFSPSCLAPRQGRSLRVQHHELQVCSMESLSQVSSRTGTQETDEARSKSIQRPGVQLVPLG